jgi:flagellar FliL protein
MLGIGGGFYYLVRSGRLSLSGNIKHKAEVVALPPTHVIVLEPLLVNLADSGGSSYLRVVVALRVANASGTKFASPQEQEGKNDKGMDAAIAPIRDTLLTVLSRQTSDELLAADGKEHLKTAMKAALAEHNPDMKAQDVFFTDFLVQR